MIHAFANKRSGQTAVASQALTHRGFFDGFTFTHGYSSVSPAESAVGNPAAFAVCWGHPDLNASATGFDFKAPLGTEISNFAVGNYNSLQWINNDQVALAQNQLWSNPEQVSSQGNQGGYGKIKQLVSGFGGVEHRLQQEQRIEGEGHDRPSQIALRAKDFIHASIIAGITAVGKGK